MTLYNVKTRTMMTVLAFALTISIISNATAVSALENYVFVTQWGSFGLDPGQFISPRGVAIDSSGNVYIAADDRVQKFSNDGSILITTWGTSGFGQGEFQFSNSNDVIAIDSLDRVYIGDFGRVQVFDSDGNFIKEWGSIGSDAGQFVQIGAIALDISDNVYTIDQGNSRIEKFDSDGSFLTMWGELGEGDGQFATPIGIAIDNNGNVYVSDLIGRIQKFDSDGNFIELWGPSATSHGIAIDSLSNVYLSDLNSNAVLKYDSTGNILLATIGAGELNEPTGLDLDSEGKVYIANNGDQTIKFYRPEISGSPKNITEAIQNIKDMNLSSNIEKTLIKPLSNAERLLEDGNGANDSGVCGNLNAFDNMVSALERANRITEDQANELAEMAEELLESLGCS